MQYPSAWLQSGSYYVAGSDNLYMTYDAMSRMQKMGSTAGAGDFVSATAYNVDGTLATMTFGGGTETRSYNTLGQLTGIGGGPAGVSIGYGFPASGNNGRASSMTFSGETVTCAYDALNRPVSASSNQGWAETYAHDRYGNLTNKGGQSIGVDQSSNRLTGGLYDANGNYFAQNGWEYDIENRLTKAVGGNSADQFYGYDAGNKRVWKRHVVGSSTIEQVFFYGAGGRLGTYDIQWELIGGSYQMRLVMREQNFYYGGRLLRSRTDFSGSGDPGWVMVDRLGSVVSRGGTVKKYRPYGEEYSVTGNNEQKFGTYYRDDQTGLDYADQRYYQYTMGRFATADPYRASGGAGDPGSWNRYAYVGGDPANFIDATGEIRARYFFEDGIGVTFLQAGPRERRPFFEDADPRDPRDPTGWIERTKKENRERLGSRLNSFRGKNCEKAFAKQGKSLDDLQGLATDLTFLDGRRDTDGGKLQAF